MILIQSGIQNRTTLELSENFEKRHGNHPSFTSQAIQIINQSQHESGSLSLNIV